jgi:hypothetical protein
MSRPAWTGILLFYASCIVGMTVMYTTTPSYWLRWGLKLLWSCWSLSPELLGLQMWATTPCPIHLLYLSFGTSWSPFCALLFVLTRIMALTWVTSGSWSKPMQVVLVSQIWDDHHQ